MPAVMICIIESKKKVDPLTIDIIIEASDIKGHLSRVITTYFSYSPFLQFGNCTI